MWRTILTFVGGLIAWIFIATALNLVLRLAIPGYASAEPSMSFTFGMQCARLLVGAAASIGAGAVAARLAPASRMLPWLLGGALTLLFIPVHVGLWNKFPLWYHLVFLGTLALLVAAGGGSLKAGKDRG